MTENDGVTYSFKDLFEKLDDRLAKGFDKLDKRIDDLNRRLDSKADNATVAALAEKVAVNEGKLEERFRKVDDRFKPIEITLATDEGVSKWKVRAANAAILLASSSVGAFLYYVASLGGHG